MRMYGTIIFPLLILVIPLPLVAKDKVVAAAARHDEHGFLVHTVESPFQTGQTDIRVLLPDQVKDAKHYPVVYVLPVEPGRETRWGDGLLEVQKHALHNQHQAIFVAPSFSHLPWYADHPTNSAIRQETYFLKAVVPFVEKTYPASDERLLLGFSKSGWGAWSLLLRHLDTFDRAAAWDAPLLMERIGQYGTSKIFGTQETFEKYQPTSLLRAKAAKLRVDKRLVLTGYGNFREHHQNAHTLLNDLNIPHDYRDGPQRKHDWHSGWMPEAVELLLGLPQGRIQRISSHD